METGPKAEYISRHATHSKGIQEPALLLPGQQTDNVLNTIEHHSRPERLSTSAEHSGRLCQTRSGNTKPNSHRASDHRHLNTSAVSGTGETGVHSMNGQP